MSSYSALLGEVDDLGYPTWWLQFEEAVRSGVVVVAQLFGQHVAQVALAEDEHPVG